MARRNHRQAFRHGRQLGVSMLFSLMALTILSLAAVTLVRSVDTTSLIFGNMGFKQDAVTTSSNATERAITWMTGRDLTLDIPALGYYATSLDNLDPTGSSGDATLGVVDWDGGTCNGIANCKVPSAPIDVRGDGLLISRYVIARLCNFSGTPGSINVSGAAVFCSQPPVAISSGQGASRGALDSGDNLRPGGTTSGPYYRVIVRTVAVGGHSTVSFTETLVHF